MKNYFHDLIEYFVKKLIKLIGLICLVNEIHLINCLLLFYNSFAKTVISYGILTYGGAAKANFDKFEKAERRILRPNFFKKSMISLDTCLNTTRS